MSLCTYRRLSMTIKSISIPLLLYSCAGSSSTRSWWRLRRRWWVISLAENRSTQNLETGSREYIHCTADSSSTLYAWLSVRILVSGVYIHVGSLTLYNYNRRLIPVRKDIEVVGGKMTKHSDECAQHLQAQDMV